MSIYIFNLKSNNLSGFFLFVCLFYQVIFSVTEYMVVSNDNRQPFVLKSYSRKTNSCVFADLSLMRPRSAGLRSAGKTSICRVCVSVCLIGKCLSGIEFLSESEQRSRSLISRSRSRRRRSREEVSDAHHQVCSWSFLQQGSPKILLRETLFPGLGVWV